ncbi:hypothetical protein P389DRAFT_176641 [Cystobasidium minutum MCA 4210]|uniref:uncharacterized protein n=1 Tax=Cystobasidium minutum MCA 4210 TaxID=1397322 RepID=UPI0034CD04BD|eukprot:jgi/Rhomi1/176641/fgenesh1_pg.1_\
MYSCPLKAIEKEDLKSTVVLLHAALSSSGSKALENTLKLFPECGLLSADSMPTGTQSAIHTDLSHEYEHAKVACAKNIDLFKYPMPECVRNTRMDFAAMERLASLNVRPNARLSFATRQLAIVGGNCVTAFDDQFPASISRRTGSAAVRKSSTGLADRKMRAGRFFQLALYAIETSPTIS